MRRWMKIIRETPAIQSLGMVQAMFIAFAFNLSGNGADPAIIKSAIGVIFVATLMLIVMVLLRAADETAAKSSDEPST